MIIHKEQRKNKAIDTMRKEIKILKADARKNFVKNYLEKNFGKGGFYSKLSTLGEIKNG